MNDSAFLSGVVLVLTLAMFAWGRLRYDLVAICALGACILLGLTSPSEALVGFSDPAVAVVAAVLIIGRAIELTGVAAFATEKLAALKAPFALQLAVLLVAAATLSAFMNNIAALAITMPAVASVCRASKLPPAAGLMPLAFATILGGMITLIGTPANLILSSVRARELGEGFEFFAMTPVAGVTALAGLAYLCVLGWRLVPIRKGEEAEQSARSVFELRCGPEESRTIEEMRAALKDADAHLLGVVRLRRWVATEEVETLKPADRVKVISGSDPWEVAKKVKCELDALPSKARDAVTARVVVAHGSPLVGRPYDTVAGDTNGELRVVAAGPRAARSYAIMAAMRIEPGDQLVLHGPAATLEAYQRYARLLEVERKAAVRVSPLRACAALAIYAAAVAGSVAFHWPTALTFAAAAAALAAFKFLPQREVYASVDWSVIVLLAAMIPVGQTFEATGAAQAVADMLAWGLQYTNLFVAAAAITTFSMLLSIFLNNVATAVIVGPIAVSVAHDLNISPDAMLIAVLIGASSDFLTPIGHQNNLLVMGPGGYRFSDYIRVGAALSVIVVLVSALMVSTLYGAPQ